MALFKQLVLGGLVMAAITASAVSAHAASSKPSKRSSDDMELSEARIEHAKELMGSYYRHSAVRKAEKRADLTAEIRRWTKRSMPKAPSKQTRSIASTIMTEARHYDFDPAFLAAVIQRESKFNPKSRGDAGEIGLMQILPDTAEWIAKKYHIEWKGEKTLLNPVMNIRIGAAYFAYLRERFDNHGRLYLAAYNMGVTNVNRALGRHVWPKDYAMGVMKNYVDFYAELDARH
jgi:soluble lytic murein transglycosylase